MTNQDQFDLIIVGAGPAGAAATLYAQKARLKVLLLDKATFPRDKVCGDAISGHSIAVLKELGLSDQIRDLPGAFVRYVVLGAPNGTALKMDMLNSDLSVAPEGYVIRREIFDNFMFENAQAAATRCIPGFDVKDLIVEDGYVRGIIGKSKGESEEKSFHAPLILGADGYRSIVSRKMGYYKYDTNHVSVALRQYYKNVDGLTEQIEVHFIDEANPGYFWMFALEDGTANIGIGMLHSAIKDRNINLKEALKAAINSPGIRDRFANATALEEPVGWNLPFGSKQYPTVGNGFMLLGDAAGLVDPFSGEGIGNALFSAKLAIKTAVVALERNDFSKDFLTEYETAVRTEIGQALSNSTKLQKIGRIRFLVNFVISKAARNRDLANLIAGMIVNEVPQKKLTDPRFYLKLLFNKNR